MTPSQYALELAKGCIAMGALGFLGVMVLVATTPVRGEEHGYTAQERAGMERLINGLPGKQTLSQPQTKVLKEILFITDEQIDNRSAIW